MGRRGFRRGFSGDAGCGDGGAVAFGHSAKITKFYKKQQKLMNVLRIHCHDPSTQHFMLMAVSLTYAKLMSGAYKLGFMTEP
jgi:hypothetical protein